MQTEKGTLICNELIYIAYQDENSTARTLEEAMLECLFEQSLISATVKNIYEESAEYQQVLNIEIAEIKNLANYLSTPYISTQHGIKGESHESVVFVAADNYSTPNVRMYSFFELWSKNNFSLPEFEDLFYSYSKIIMEVEAKLGMKISDLTAETHNENECLLPCCIPFVLKIPPVSVFQSRNRDDKNTVGADICRIGEPADDAKNRRSHASVLLNIVAQCNKFCCGFIDLVGTELYLKRAPFSVLQFNHRVNFLIVVVLIMIQIRPERLGINLQIAFHQSFKQKSKGFKVADQFIRSGFQQGAGERGIAEMSFFGLLHANGRTDICGKRISIFTYIITHSARFLNFIRYNFEYSFREILNYSIENATLIIAL